MMRTMTAAFVALVCMASPAAAQETKLEWKDYPSLRVGKWLRVDIHARVQGDIRESEVRKAKEKEDPDDGARRRVGIEGRIGKLADYQVEYELASHEWRDVFVDYRQLKGLQLQGGAFKVPFGLEETTGVTKLDFVYRTRMSNELAPGRDQGVMAHGKLLKSRLQYETGVFQHDGDNARPNKPSRVGGQATWAGRIVFEPFHKKDSPSLRNFQIGAATTYSKLPEGMPAVRGKTVLGARFFDSDVWVNGSRRRMGIEGRWRPGPLSFQAEFMRLADERLHQATDDSDLPPLVSKGWYGSAAYRWRWFEGAGRYEALTFGDVSGNPDASSSPRADIVLGNAHRALTLGGTVFANRWIKLQGNVIREQVHDISIAPDTKPVFWSRVLRVQVVL